MQEMKIISLAVRLVCGIFAGLSLVYMSVFVLDIKLLLSLAPKDYHNLIYQLLGVNHKPEWNRLTLPFLSSAPAINNTLLAGLFGLQHSSMLRGPLKKLLTFVLPESYHRSVYVFASASCLYIMYICWIPMTEVIWDIVNPWLRLVVFGLMLFSVCGVTTALLNLNPIQMLGIAKRPEAAPTRLVLSGLYGFVRHPIYTFSLMLLWVTPRLTLGHLLLATMFTLYVVYAVAVFEEPDLVKEFGSDYEKYMKTTPRFVPKIPWFKKQKRG